MLPNETVTDVPACTLWFELCVCRSAATRADHVANKNRAETSGDRFLDEEIAGCAHSGWMCAETAVKQLVREKIAARTRDRAGPSMGGPRTRPARRQHAWGVDMLSGVRTEGPSGRATSAASAGAAPRLVRSSWAGSWSLLGRSREQRAGAGRFERGACRASSALGRGVRVSNAAPVDALLSLRSLSGRSVFLAGPAARADRVKGGDHGRSPVAPPCAAVRAERVQGGLAS